MEPLCGLIETNIRLCISDTVIKNKTKQNNPVITDGKLKPGEVNLPQAQSVRVEPDESSGGLPVHPRALPLC